MSFHFIFVTIFIRDKNPLYGSWFSPVFDGFFMEFINIKPAYIKGWWQRLKQRNKNTQIVV